MKTKWVKIADSFSDLEKEFSTNNRQVRQVHNKSVLLLKHADKFYAVNTRCPHQGASLKNGVCEEGKIVCPWHRYGFDLETGRGAGLYLENYPLKEMEGGVFLGIEYFSWFGE